MKKNVVVRLKDGTDHNCILEEGAVLYFDSNPNNVLILTGEDDDGNYLINPQTGAEGFMLYNPVSDNYWFTRINKVPNVQINHAFRTCFCRSLKYRSFMIPKCGSSSIVASTLVYDKLVDQSRLKDSGGIAWESCPESEKVIQRLCLIENMDLDSKVLKHFTVVDEPLKHFTRWVNYTWTKGYNKYFNRELSDEKYIDELLWALPYITSYKPDMDEHVVLQSRHIEQSDKFNFNPEYVKLSRLPQYYEKNFGKPLLKSNVTKVEKRFTDDVYTAGQMEKIMKYLEPDYKMYKGLF